MSVRRTNCLIVLGLIALTVAAFAHVCTFKLIQLDDPLFAEDVHVQGGLTLENVMWAFTTTQTGFWFPMTWISLQLDATLFGPDSPSGFHASNLAWHVANVLLVFVAFKKMTGTTYRSALVAALFAVHPMHVESVAWVTERKDMLFAFFWLLGLLAYLHYAARPGLGRYFLVWLCFVLSLMSKPMAVTFPFTLILLDIWPLRRFAMDRPGMQDGHTFVPRPWFKLLLEKVPWLATAIASALLTIGTHQSHINDIMAVPLSVRLGFATVFYCWYIGKTFWPTDLVIFLPFPDDTYLFWQASAAIFFLAAVTLALWNWRRQPALLIGWFWFLGVLVPVIGLASGGPQGESVGSRFTYVPHIGFFMALVWGLADLAARWRLALVWRWALAVALLACLGTLTWFQARRWRDTYTLMTYTVSVMEDHPMANRNLGIYYLGKGDAERAEFYLGKSIDAQFRIGEGYFHYGLAKILGKKFDQAERSFRAVLELDPQHASSHLYLGLLLVGRKKMVEAEDHLLFYLKNPTSKNPEILGEAHAKLALVFLSQGHLGLAQQHVESALQLHPSLAEAHFARGVLLGRLDQWNQAVPSLSQAIQLPPASLDYQAQLAFAYAQLGNGQEAAAHYQALLANAPSWPKDACILALQLATDPDDSDPARSLELALQACQATQFKQPAALDVLAVAYAALGQWQDATATLHKALALSSDPVLTQFLQERLRLIESRKLPGKS